MNEGFFRKHRNTLAGLSAITAILGGGIFTFIGNTSEKTRNTIKDNSGTIVGVGDEVTIQSGGVVVNEYDADFEGLKNALASLRIAGVQCKAVLAERDKIAQHKVGEKLTKPAFHIAGMLYDPNMSSALSEDMITYIEHKVNRGLTPNAMLISSLARDEMNRERNLKQGLESAKARLQANPKYADDPAAFAKEWEKVKAEREASPSYVDRSLFALEIFKEQSPDAQFYDVLGDESLPVGVRLDRATGQLISDFESLCTESQKMHAQLEKKLG